MAGGVERSALSDEVLLILEVAHPLMEVPTFQVVVDAGELFVLPLNLGDNGVSISFKLGMLFMVAVVALNLDGGSEVHRMDHCSQGEEGGSIGL
jgi:hypothetical protein